MSSPEDKEGTPPLYTSLPLGGFVVSCGASPGSLPVHPASPGFQSPRFTLIAVIIPGPVDSWALGAGVTQSPGPGSSSLGVSPRKPPTYPVAQLCTRVALPIWASGPQLYTGIE